MTRTEVKKLSKSALKRIAFHLGILIPQDYQKNDILDEICERLGEDPVAWKLLDQVDLG